MYSGPAWYESLGVFPESSPIVVTVNLGNNTIQLARDAIQAGIDHIGLDRIRAFEREYLQLCANVHRANVFVSWQRARSLSWRFTPEGLVVSRLYRSIPGTPQF